MNADEIIACSRCHCQHRAEDFGVNRLGKRWKTCVECRLRSIDERAERQRGYQANYKSRIRADPLLRAAQLAADKERRERQPRCPHNMKALCVRCPESRGAGLLRTGKSRVQEVLGKLPAGEYGRILGCDGPTMIAHLEALFIDGLTWENYGEQWQIDHTVSILCSPGTTGGLPSTTEIRERCHYSNLRPITIADHRAKTRVERVTRRALVADCIATHRKLTDANSAHLKLTNADIDTILADVLG